MKPKYQRVHYARKQLHNKDPRRYCRYNRYILTHEVDGPIFGFAEDDGTKYLGYCRHCESRIETFVRHDERPRTRIRTWNDLTWRAELFIVKEDDALFFIE